MKVFYITLKGGMREVARFMTDYLAAYDYSEFEVKHDFQRYPVIIFEPHFEDDDIDIEVAEVIQSDLHFEVITYGMCEQEELEFNTPYYSDCGSITSLVYKVNHLRADFFAFCTGNCEKCKYYNLSDCKIAFTLDKGVQDDETEQ